MAKITAIETQRRNPQRVNVYLDGEFAFGLARIVAAWLQTGQELSQDKIAQLQTEDAREVAIQRALHFLSYRPRSLDEIRKNLRKHKIPERVIEETLERLQRDRLAGDEQFARLWVENRNEFRPRSRRVLALELRQKGLDDETIDSVLNENVDEDQLAYKAGLQKARKLHGLDWQDFRRKLSAFLARRGFPYPVVAPIVKRIWDELSTDDEQQI